jgi:hypothetical protein
VSSRARWDARLGAIAHDTWALPASVMIAPMTSASPPAIGPMSPEFMPPLCCRRSGARTIGSAVSTANTAGTTFLTCACWNAVIRVSVATIAETITAASQSPAIPNRSPLTPSPKSFVAMSLQANAIPALAVSIAA